jgi:hypothetical protein
MRSMGLSLCIQATVRKRIEAGKSDEEEEQVFFGVNK